VIAKEGNFNIMYSLGLLIVELETARRRLLEVLRYQMVNEQMDLERRQFPMGHGQSAACRVSKPRHQFATLRLGGRDAAELSTATRKNGDPG
jgi:hypothetical protein